MMKNKSKILILSLTLLSLSLSYNLFGQGKWDKKKTAMPKVADDGITNEVHKKNVGKIVWSSDKISTTSPDESKFRTSFNLIDNIYGRAYFPHSIQNEPLFKYKWGKKNAIFQGCQNDRCHYTIQLYINDEPKYTFECSDFEDSQVKSTTYQFGLMPKATDGEMDRTWKQVLEALPDGEHKVKIEIYSGSCDLADNYRKISDVWAVGEFNLVKKAGQKMSFNKTFDDFKTGMVNADLEQQALELANKYTVHAKLNYKYDEVKISDDNWSIKRNEYSGLITHRSIRILFSYKQSNGECFVERFNMKQEYDGYEYNNELRYVDGPWGFKPVDCKD